MNKFNYKSPKNHGCKETFPVCYAIGDIEGDFNKLQYYDSFIKNHPNDEFVFIGDIFDDLSDANIEKEKNWSCINLICENYLNDEISFKRDSDKSEVKSAVSLPSAFHQIKFGKKMFKEVPNRVKFVAGNSECDCLSDILYNCEEKDGKYVFGKGKWKKTVTFEQLCLLYRYLANCNGVIELNNEECSKTDPGFKNTIYFRHSINKFRVNANVSSHVEQRTNALEKDIKDRKFIFISGHSKVFTCTGLMDHPNDDSYYIIDTSSIEPKMDKRSPKEYPYQIRGRGSKDHRMAAIFYDDDAGYSVDIYPDKFKFKRWWKRYSLEYITNNIQQFIFGKIKYFAKKIICFR